MTGVCHRDTSEDKISITIIPDDGCQVRTLNSVKALKLAAVEVQTTSENGVPGPFENQLGQVCLGF